MTQSDKMQAALLERVVPKLMEQGFAGEYPHFRRVFSDRIELLGFVQHQYGVAFNVEVSVIFPQRPKEQSNHSLQGLEPPEKATVFSTRKRFRLKGMFDGWFYYTDVYKSTRVLANKQTYETFEAVGEQRKRGFIPGPNQVLVQQADDALHANIADEVNRQMEDAYAWLKQHSTPARLRKAK